MSHEIYYTLYLQGSETDYYVHRKSTRISGDILVFLIAHMCALYINGIAWILRPVLASSKWIMRIVRFMFAWELFAYCWSPNRLVFMKSPYHRIKFIAWGRHHVVYAFTKQFHEIKYDKNLLSTKIFNYLVVQKSAKFYTLKNFYVYGSYHCLTVTEYLNWTSWKESLELVRPGILLHLAA